MTKKAKAITYAVGALVGLLAFVAAGLFVFLDIDAYKPRIEAAISEAFGMEVKVGGRLGVSFFPGMLVSLKDVHIRNQGAEIATAKEARIGVGLLALLRKGIEIKHIALQHPSVSIEKGSDGRFNFERPEQPAGPLPKLNLAKLTFADGTLYYLDKRSGVEFEADDCSLSHGRLQLEEGERAAMMKDLSLAAELVCGEVRTKSHTVSDLKFTLAGQRGIFDLKPLTLRAFAGQGSGSIRADFTGAVPQYDVHYSLTQLHIGEFLKTLSPPVPAEGTMDFAMTLSLQGKTMNELTQSMAGQFSLRGKNLILNGRDLDQQFARYASSQNFNLVDVGALFFVGPVGLAVTKGFNFASIFQESEGRSEIRTVISEWKVERGVAHSRDVAMATNENRVALQGELDFVNQQFYHMTVALIDAKGCIRAQQEIHGDFNKPVLEKPSTLKTLTGPVVKLLEKLGSLFPDGECDVFYAGSVAPPK
jgi:AsmA protein